MKNWLRVFEVFSVVVVVIFLFFGINVDAKQMGNYFNGEEYVTLSENERVLVVAGLFDMLSYEWGQPIYADAADANTRAQMARIEQCVQGKTLRQMRDILDRYFAAEPEAKRYNLASSFVAALITQCK